MSLCNEPISNHPRLGQADGTEGSPSVSSFFGFVRDVIKSKSLRRARSLESLLEIAMTKGMVPGITNGAPSDLWSKPMPNQAEPNDVEHIRVECDLPKRELLAMWKEELDFRKEKWSQEVAKQSRWSLASFGPGLSAVIAALVGGVIGATITGCFNLALEEKKLRSALVLKSCEATDENEVRKRLSFLLQIGLLEDPDGKLEKRLKSPDPVPTGWDDSWSSDWENSDRSGTSPPKRIIPPKSPQSP